MRRRSKAVTDVLGAMIRYGVPLARSVELTIQLERILAAGPLFWFLGLGDFHHAVSDVHHRLSDFTHQVVVYRRDEAIRRWRNWVREDPLVGGSGVLADPSRIDEEFRKAWLPYFCRPGQREASLEEFALEVDEWLPLLPEVHLPRLTGQVLADDLFQVVRCKGATAGGLDGWGWREFKVLPLSWYDELARILAKVEDLGVWPDGLLDAHVTMIPKTDGDATPLVRGLLVFSRSSIVFRHLLVCVNLRVGFSLGCLSLSSVLVVVAVLSRLGKLLLLILRKFFLVPMILTFISLLLMLSSPLILLIGGSWIGF